MKKRKFIIVTIYYVALLCFAIYIYGIKTKERENWNNFLVAFQELDLPPKHDVIEAIPSDRLGKRFSIIIKYSSPRGIEQEMKRYKGELELKTHEKSYKDGIEVEYNHYKSPDENIEYSISQKGNEYLILIGNGRDGD